MSAGAAELGAIYDDAIRPALRLLPGPMTSREALVMMFAIGLQESRMVHRYQLVLGPGGKEQHNDDGTVKKGAARGLFQFEQGGGVKGVMTHPSSKSHALTVLGALGHTDVTEHAVWQALETDDVLAAAFARLLLWTDSKPLPKTDNPWGAWDCYLRVWRPGRPHHHTWMEFHAEAVMTAMELFQ
jgi:hypothetical protein